MEIAIGLFYSAFGNGDVRGSLACGGSGGGGRVRHFLLAGGLRGNRNGQRECQESENFHKSLVL